MDFHIFLNRSIIFFLVEVNLVHLECMMWILRWILESFQEDLVTGKWMKQQYYVT